jgi:hypothetical protein
LDRDSQANVVVRRDLHDRCGRPPVQELVVVVLGLAGGHRDRVLLVLGQVEVALFFDDDRDFHVDHGGCGQSHDEVLRQRYRQLPGKAFYKALVEQYRRPTYYSW